MILAGCMIQPGFVWCLQRNRNCSQHEALPLQSLLILLHLNRLSNCIRLLLLSGLGRSNQCSVSLMSSRMKKGKYIIFNCGRLNNCTRWPQLLHFHVLCLSRWPGRINHWQTLYSDLGWRQSEFNSGRRYFKSAMRSFFHPGPHLKSTLP